MYLRIVYIPSRNVSRRGHAHSRLKIYDLCGLDRQYEKNQANIMAAISYAVVFQLPECSSPRIYGCIRNGCK